MVRAKSVNAREQSAPLDVLRAVLVLPRSALVLYTIWTLRPQPDTGWGRFLFDAPWADWGGRFEKSWLGPGRLVLIPLLGPFDFQGAEVLTASSPQHLCSLDGTALDSAPLLARCEFAQDRVPRCSAKRLRSSFCSDRRRVRHIAPAVPLYEGPQPPPERLGRRARLKQKLMGYLKTNGGY